MPQQHISLMKSVKSDLSKYCINPHDEAKLNARATRSSTRKKSGIPYRNPDYVYDCDQTEEVRYRSSSWCGTNRAAIIERKIPGKGKGVKLKNKNPTPDSEEEEITFKVPEANPKTNKVKTGNTELKQQLIADLFNSVNVNDTQTKVIGGSVKSVDNILSLNLRDNTSKSNRKFKEVLSAAEQTQTAITPQWEITNYQRGAEQTNQQRNFLAVYG